MMRFKRVLLILLASVLLTTGIVPALAAPDTAAAAESEAPLPFEGCALIGDSISDGLRIYASRERKKDPSFLGGLEFLTATSYNLKYAASSKPKKYLKYKGKSMRPQDAVKAMSADTVFIMLGMNDIFRDFEDSLTRYEKLIANIREESPDIKIYVLGVTPVVKGKERSGFTNERVDQFNELLADMTIRLNCQYISFTDQLRDETGGLKKEYSSDKFVHLKGGAFEIYAAALENALEVINKQNAIPDTFLWLTADFQTFYQ